MNCSRPGLPVIHKLLELTQTHVHHLILCLPLLFPPSIFPSIRVFSNESVLHIRWPKYWSFSFSISSSNEYSGLISFRVDWLDLLTVQGALKTLLQHCSSKAPILRRFRCVYSSIGQGIPRTARNYQKQGEKHGTYFRFQKDPTLGIPWF